MGSDIHLYAEIKKKSGLIEKLKFWEKPKWRTLDKLEKSNEEGEPISYDVPYCEKFYTHGRSYNLFAALCGVRGDCFSQEVNPISQPKGVPSDSNKLYQEVVKGWDSDGHSHSWNTLYELENYDWTPWGETCDYFRNEVISKLKSYDVSPHNIRIIYFFDN